MFSICLGQSTDGIRSRVARHLTSARSDIIANRHIDVWEIAEVWAYPLLGKSGIGFLESVLMNGTVPPLPPTQMPIPEPSQKVMVMSPEEISEKCDPAQRLPRQAAHFAQMVRHFLAVKEFKQIARAMSAHFQRLSRYHEKLLGIAATAADDGE